MKFVSPIKGKNTEQLYDMLRQSQAGFYPIGANDSYHGGVHFEGEHPVVALASGTIIAYRYTKQYKSETEDNTTYKYSNCFVLIRHHYKTPKEQELVYYTLYNHLRPWSDDDANESENGNIAIFGTPGFKIINVETYLKVRTSREINDNPSNEAGSLAPDTTIAATKLDETWARIDEGNLQGNYFCHTYNGTQYGQPAIIPGEPEFDSIITDKKDVKAGDIIGHTGLYEAPGLPAGYRAVHVEVFAAPDARSFLRNAKDEGTPTHIVVPQGTQLKIKVSAETSDDPNAFTLEDGDTIGTETRCMIDAERTIIHDDASWFWVANPEGASGYAPEDSISKQTPYNWPQFRIINENQTEFSTLFAPGHLEVEYDELPRFFQEIVDTIDANNNGKVSRKELREAYSQQPEVFDRLAHVISVHPSEWWAGKQKSIWNRLLNMFDQDRSDNLENRIDELCWWDTVADNVDDFPSSATVYHWNPVPFIVQMRAISGKRAILAQAVDAEPGDPSATEVLNEARTILRDWGFRTGAMGDEHSVRSSSSPEFRKTLVQGNSNQHIEHLRASAERALAADDQEIREREAFFSQDGTRIVKRTISGEAKTVEIKFTPNVAGWALSQAGVEQAEAFAKCEWAMWKVVIDTAFETEVDSILVSGTWRPVQDTNSTFGSGNIDMLGDAWDAVYNRDPHTHGRGIDIIDIGGEAVAYEGQPATNEEDDTQPDKIKLFSYNCKDTEIVTQVIQPWMHLGAVSSGDQHITYENGFRQNMKALSIETSHDNHMHLTLHPGAVPE